MKCLLFSIAILLNVKSFAKNNQCFITINLHECVNCYQAIRNIDKIDSSLRTSLVFKKNDERQIKPFLLEVVNLNWDKNRIIISDSLYYALNDSPQFSYINVLNASGKKIFSSLLKELNNNLETINSFKIQNPLLKRERLLPDSIVLSHGTSIRESDTDYFLYDYLYNKLYRISKNKPNSFSVIGSDYFNKEKIHKILFDKSKYSYDTALVKAPILESVGKNKVDIQGFFLDKDIVYILLGYNYVADTIYEGSRVNMVMQKLLLAKLQGNQTLKYIAIPSIPNREYIINSAVNFLIKDNNIFFPIVKRQYNKLKNKVIEENYIFVSYKISDKGATFNRFLNAILPNYFTARNLGYKFGSIIYAYPFIAYPMCNDLINLETGKTYDLPYSDEMNDFTNPEKPLFRYFLLTMKREGNNLRLLVKDNGEYYTTLIDSNEKILEKKKLETNLSSIISNSVFSANRTIIGLDNNAMLVRVKY